MAAAPPLSEAFPVMQSIPRPDCCPLCGYSTLHMSGVLNRAVERVTPDAVDVLCHHCAAVKSFHVALEMGARLIHAPEVDQMHLVRIARAVVFRPELKEWRAWVDARNLLAKGQFDADVWQDIPAMCAEAFMADAGAHARQMQEFHDAGLRLAFDDRYRPPQIVAVLQEIKENSIRSMF